MKLYRLLLFIPSLVLFNACSSTQKEAKRNSASAAKKELSAKDTVPYRASYTKHWDLIHTQLEVHFDWEKQELEGKANLSLKPHFYSTDSLSIDAKGMDIKSSKQIVNGKGKALDYTYDSLQLHLKFPRSISRQDTVLLSIHYISRPNLLDSKGSRAIKDDKGLYFINPLGINKLKPIQVWTQGETEASSCWFPTLDAPNQKSTQDISITVDQRFTTLSNGKFMGSTQNSDSTRTDRWKQDLPHAPYLFMMAVGEFAVTKDTWNGKPVHYYTVPEDSADARLVFGNTPKMLEFFSNRLGVKYPWDKFSQVIVRDYVSGAMENTGATIYGDFVMKNKRQLLDDNHEDIIAHELFHHWFGDLVTCESWSNLSLNESFATYGEYLWIEHHYGKFHADRHHYKDLLKYLDDEPWKPIINFHYDSREDMFNRHSYEKGGVVLHQLRKIVGDEAFFAALQKYLQDHQFKSAEIHDLRMAFEDVTGQDWNWYFNQWFLQEGHPILDFSFQQKSDSLLVTIEQKQVSEGIQPFTLPLTLQLFTESQIKKQDIEITKPKETFLIKTLEDIIFVNIDPDNGICAEIKQKQTPTQALHVWNNSKQYRDKLWALYAAYEDTTDIAWELLDQASRDPLEVYRRIALNYLADSKDGLSDDYKEKLIRSAKEDEESKVRALSISLLSQHFGSDSSMIPLYKAGLADSSYAVIRESIKALHKIKREDALLRAVELEKEDDSYLLYTLSKLYSDLSDESKLNFYYRAMDLTESYFKTAIMENYKTYLSSKSHEFIWKGMKKLRQIALYDNDKSVRKEAGLIIHDLHQLHLKRLEDINKDIRDQEKSSKGKSNYDLKMLKEKRAELLEKEAAIQEMMNEIIQGEKNASILEAWETAGFVLQEVVEVPKVDTGDLLKTTPE